MIFCYKTGCYNSLINIKYRKKGYPLLIPGREIPEDFLPCLSYAAFSSL